MLRYLHYGSQFKYKGIRKLRYLGHPNPPLPTSNGPAYFQYYQDEAWVGGYDQHYRST